jgi:hypothetical protein
MSNPEPVNAGIETVVLVPRNMDKITNKIATEDTVVSICLAVNFLPKTLRINGQQALTTNKFLR